jgi:gamma-glutamyltranspeptidase/glutathione hydrolase
MLTKNGSAVDAAVAAAIALTVVEPTMNGIGSDAFAIVAEGGEIYGLNASGRAPRGWTPERFSGCDTMPSIGWDSATVPGTVSAWVALHRRFGRLPFETLFEPAIRYARDGFLVTPVISTIWQNQVERLSEFRGFKETFLPGGRAPAPGEIFRCPEQARTLELIATTQGEAFYRGSLAETIASASKRDGGVLSLDDLGEHAPEWVAPLAVDFQGYRVHELPPNGQGLAALIALGILDRFDLDGLDPDSADIHHLEIEATKLGMADVKAHVGDPRTMFVRAEALLSGGYLDDRARLIRRERASAPNPGRPRQHGTVYLAAADAGGMMVSLIQSNYRGFGSGIVVAGTGISLNNRGSCFVLERGHPNEVGPRKRPLNTIIPGFATRDGRPVAAFGVMGGTMQPQGHVQLATRLFSKGQNPQAAVDAPRWRVEGNRLMIEPAWDRRFRDALADRGHDLEDSSSLDFGAAEIIWRLGDAGYAAASESRRDGQAVGF